MSDFIKNFWDGQAAKHKTSHWVSWGDNFALDLEIENISRFVKKGEVILDVGCANGYSTLAHLPKAKSITGVDYSEEMIKQARIRKSKVKSKKKIEFDVADIRNLPFKNNSFSFTYTTRVLINLPNWQEQKQGIDECIRVTKNGGTVLFSEAFWEPLVLLNSLRALKQLEPLAEHDFNRYLKKKKLEEYLKKKKLSFEVVDFSSVYYLGSRFLRDIVTKTDDFPGYSNPINHFFYELEQKYSGGDFGIQQAYVIKVKK